MAKICRITLSLDKDWVFEHKWDRPIDMFIRSCRTAYGDNFQIEASTLTSCTVTISAPASDDEDAVEQKIKGILGSDLKIPSGSQIATLKFEQNDVNDPAQAQKVETPTAARGSRSEVSGTAQSDGRTQEMKQDTGAAERIAALTGCAEFKTLIGGIDKAAPIIKKHNCAEDLISRSYIFAINDGCGLTTCASLFCERLTELGLFPGKKDSLYEGRIHGGAGIEDPFDEFVRIVKLGPSGKLFCIDISEWMSKTSDVGFKGFLKELNSVTDKNIFIFRVPFIEKEVLLGIKADLDDVMAVQTISFPPFTTDELAGICAGKLSARGFTLTESAGRVFRQKIAEEKSDGKFYGVRTVDKVIHEMILSKEFSDAERGNDNTVIEDSDIISITKPVTGCYRDGFEQLEDLIGMEKVSGRLKEIIGQIKMCVSNPELGVPSIHMRFVGNPGTGKTTVARILGRIMQENGILRNGDFFEHTGRDFCGRYIGETAPKTAAMCRDAYGSVLFIDEAYTLWGGDYERDPYGKEAIDTLISEMENHRSDFIVIMAGYTDEMRELMKANEGLQSRMPYEIEFPNYTREQLIAIFFKMMDKSFDADDEFRNAVRDYFLGLPDQVITAKEFSNARFVRNLFERTWSKAATRSQLAGPNGRFTLLTQDFRLAGADSDISSLIGDKKRSARLGF